MEWNEQVDDFSSMPRGIGVDSGVHDIITETTFVRSLWEHFWRVAGRCSVQNLLFGVKVAAELIDGSGEKCSLDLHVGLSIADFK